MPVVLCKVGTFEEICLSIFPCHNGINRMFYSPPTVRDVLRITRIDSLHLFVITPIFAAFEEVCFTIASPGESPVQPLQFDWEPVLSYVFWSFNERGSFKDPVPKKQSVPLMFVLFGKLAGN